MNSRIGLALLGLVASMWSFASTSLEHCGKEGAACIEYGAYVYHERCTLCHGSDGFGEGILPLAAQDYPNTNLLEPRFPVDRASITRVIRYGAELADVSAEMPPWGDELTAAQLESVAEFVTLLHVDRDRASALLELKGEGQVASLRVGRGIYRGRCALCHGEFGTGDGKLSRIIKDPPPFDLTMSQVPDAYLESIITLGGASLGRSSRMPPWGDEMSETELASVIMFIKTFR